MGAVPSSTNANIRESTGNYSFQHNEMTVVSGIVQSTQDPGKSADITEKLNSMIYIHAGMDTLTIDSAKLNDYAGYDVDPFVVKDLLLTIAYKSSASGTMTNTYWSSDLNQFRETTRTLYLKELGGDQGQTAYSVTSDDPEKFKGGELMIDQEKAGFSYNILFPGETNQVKQDALLTYDSATDEWCGYKFNNISRPDVGFVKIKMHQSFDNRIINNPNIQYLYLDNKKQTMVFMYSDFISPIRNELSIPMVKAMLEKQGQDANTNIVFLNLTRSSPEIDAANLELLYKYGHTLFLSSLGSGTVKYLSDIFFSKKPEGVMHINAFSTALSLIGTPNLMRLYSPDIGNIPIFTALCPYENVVIIKGDGSWADGLSNSIQANLDKANKIVSTYTIANSVFTDDITVTNEYDEILAQNYQDADVTIVIISDYAKNLTIHLNEMGYFTNNVKNFKLVYGDTTPTTSVDNTLFDVFAKGDAGVLLPLITNSDIELQTELNTDLNEQYADSDIVLDYSMINIASNLYDIPLSDRSKYSIAAKMVFNSTKDNATAYYSVVGWDTPETTYIKTIFLTETNRKGELSIYRSDLIAPENNTPALGVP
jgi:hypothetical protein